MHKAIKAAHSASAAAASELVRRSLCRCTDQAPNAALVAFSRVEIRALQPWIRCILVCFGALMRQRRSSDELLGK